MTSPANIEVEQEPANERNFGQRMVSPGNVGNDMECQRENLVDGQPLINNHRIAVLCIIQMQHHCQATRPARSSVLH